MKKLLILILAVIPAVAGGQETGKILSAEGGRFVFGQVSDAPRDKFLLDTETGRVWQVQTTKDNDSGLVLMPIKFFSRRRGMNPEPVLSDTPLEAMTTMFSDPDEEVNDPEAQSLAAPEYLPEEYETLAAKLEAEGETDLAQKARAKAAELRASGATGGSPPR